VVSCTDAKTGQDIWEDRFEGQHLPSPIVAGDRIYFCNDRGDCTVIRAADKFEVLARNKLADGMTSSPAVADGALFLRTKTALYRIESK
jgi:outer membrane protein assembly factor BamB